MKKFLVAGITAAAFCSAPAIAADMPVKAPAYKAVDPGFSWTGCYVGVEAGYGWGSTDVNAATDGHAILHGSHVDGGLGGGTLGCNWQTGAWVWGVENDFSWAGFRGTGLDLSNPAFFEGVKANWLDTLRARVGYAVDRSFWYVTGGAAFSDIKVSAEHLGITPKETESKTATGWTIGGGVEYAIDPHWTAKIEYLYVDFGRDSYAFTSYIDRSASLKENIVRVGLNYKFGDWGKGPVSAKY
jgi:outer membrane immunogenic protein